MGVLNDMIPHDAAGVVATACPQAMTPTSGPRCKVWLSSPWCAQFRPGRNWLRLLYKNRPKSLSSVNSRRSISEAPYFQQRGLHAITPTLCAPLPPVALHTPSFPLALRKVAEQAPGLLSWLDRCADLGLTPDEVAAISMKRRRFQGSALRRPALISWLNFRANKGLRLTLCKAPPNPFL